MAKALFTVLSQTLIVAFCLVLISPGAHAISVPNTQEQVEVTIERDSSHSFFLLISDVDEETILTSDGDIKDWVRFGEEKQKQINVSSSFFMTIVLVTISVPDDADLDEYTGKIRADGRRLTDLRVKVTLELSDVKAFEQLSDVDEEVGSLNEQVEHLTDSLNTMRVDMAALEAEVSSSMVEISDYQKNLSALEKERNELASENNQLLSELKSIKDKTAELEQSNQELNAITGSLISTQVPGMFLGGIILGIVIVTLVLKRDRVIEKIRSRSKKMKGPDSEKKEDKFRYSFT
jgi:hypothetical protein